MKVEVYIRWKDTQTVEGHMADDESYCEKLLSVPKALNVYEQVLSLKEAPGYGSSITIARDLKMKEKINILRNKI
jgi:hypothetical protein